MSPNSVELGPDTGDLGIRVGIHSGPVTAGVLRGEKSRFQLFGDSEYLTTERLRAASNAVLTQLCACAQYFHSRQHCCPNGEYWFEKSNSAVPANG